ncbi:MAG TPA: IclR family transcriptional regulator [Methylomirabilota bacterium]|nr:IclR family transcriptional regulator [Methylomirabilota bacterium]
MPGRRPSPNPPQVKTVEKALKVLLHLGAAGRDLGVQEVARGAGLHPSTAYRLLSVLARHHFVQPGSAPGRYTLGLRLAELGHAALGTLELRAKARPSLERLMAETRETVHLMMLDGDTGIYVDRVESPQRIRVASSLGQREPLHVSAVGKAILAHLPAERFARLAAAGFPRLTPRTLTATAQLARHLREIAARGFALDNEEGEPGIRCVGAPIFDHRGHVIGSLSVSGPAYRLPLARLTAWGPLVREAAAHVSAALGFRPAARPSAPRRTGARSTS